MLTGIPAECSTCGLVFTSPKGIVVGDGVKGLTLSGNRISCPQCGSMARMVDGTFDVAEGGGLRVITATPENVDLLRRAGHLIESLLDAGAEPEEILQQVAEVAPEIAARLSPDRKQLSTFAKAAVGAIIGAVLAVPPVREAEHLYDRFRGFDQHQPASVTPHPPALPPGSEGVVTISPEGGMKITWRPGTHPRARRDPK